VVDVRTMEATANTWTRKIKACTPSPAMGHGVDFMVGRSRNAHRVPEMPESGMKFSSVQKSGSKGSVIVQHPVLGDGVDHHPSEKVCISLKWADGARHSIANFLFATCRYERHL
jgi:hypothetical protein